MTAANLCGTDAESVITRTPERVVTDLTARDVKPFAID